MHLEEGLLVHTEVDQVCAGLDLFDALLAPAHSHLLLGPLRVDQPNLVLLSLNVGQSPADMAFQVGSPLQIRNGAFYFPAHLLIFGPNSLIRQLFLAGRHFFR